MSGMNSAFERRPSRQLHLGTVKIGGGADISIQSMCNTPTADIVATLNQLRRLSAAGADIGRLAVPDLRSAEALPYIVKESPLPLVADIHFDYRLALAAIRSSVSGLRINPGNIGGAERVRLVADAARNAGIPIRIGVNGGSLEHDLLEKYGGITAGALVESALRQAELLENSGFSDIKLSLKSSDVPTMVSAYRLAAAQCDYPLHIGVTETGTFYRGSLKSALGIGTLLLEGIGDTLRVSLTDDPVREVELAKDILSILGLRRTGWDIVACPTCGRTEIDLIGLAQQVEQALAAIEPLKPLKVAVMGCVVNGPGEAREADIGIAGGVGEGLLIKKGEIVRKVPEDQLLSVLREELANWK